MRLALIIPAVLLAAVLAFSGQLSGTIVSREIDQADWAISDWSGIRLGELSIVHLPAGDALQIYSLTTIPRPAPPVHVRSARPACDGNCYVVSPFDYGNTNQLGGFFSSFSKAPSTAHTGLQRWDDNHRALTLDYVKTGSGYCGMWVHLFDFKRPIAERVYLDSGGFSYLTFWIRGLTGREKLLLKVADAQWEIREDALSVGEVGVFLPKGRIENEWRQAVVPLASFPRRLNMRELASLVFETTETGEGRIAIKDLAFCRNREPLISLSPPTQSVAGSRIVEKALWVWNTAEIIGRPEAQQTLIEFCRRNGFSHLFLQLPNDETRLGTGGEITLELGMWRIFLELLNKNNLHPYALDGFKNYALPEYHQRVLKTVDNVIDYNRSVEARQRFQGIHYDIEPYLIAGFLGSRRQPILTGFLSLLEKAAARVRPTGMTFGVDIPFWYDSPDELTGQLFPLEFNGKKKYASEHIIDLVDHVAIMDYRTFAYGADGIAGLAEAELAYAARAGKKAFVGLETGALPDEDLVEFEGEPRRGLPEKPPADNCVVLERHSGKAVAYVVARSRWHEFLERPQARDSSSAAPLWWPVHRIVHVPASKLTFASLGADRLERAMKEALEELLRYPSFAGYAVHDYLGFRKLLDSSAGKSR